LTQLEPLREPRIEVGARRAEVVQLLLRACDVVLDAMEGEAVGLAGGPCLEDGVARARITVARLPDGTRDSG